MCGDKKDRYIKNTMIHWAFKNRMTMSVSHFIFSRFLRFFWLKLTIFFLIFFYEYSYFLKLREIFKFHQSCWEISLFFWVFFFRWLYQWWIRHEPAFYRVMDRWEFFVLSHLNFWILKKKFVDFHRFSLFIWDIQWEPSSGFFLNGCKVTA